jgi:hypothetical protein
LLDYSIVDKEIYYGKDHENKKEKRNHKSKETCHLYLFKLWEGRENAIPSLFSGKDRTSLYLPILRLLYRRSPARMCAYGGRDEICL